MKVAYFSPFPRKQTGIATYSDHLVREVRNLMPVDCYDFRNDQAGDPSISFGDFARIGRISDLLKYDAIMYQVGNNRHFHLDILKLLRDAMVHFKFMNARRVWDAMPILNRNGT